MANSIVLKAKAISTLDEYVAFSVALALNDGTKDIPATFSITTEEATLPMVGVTEYGKMVGFVSASAESATPITVNATDRSGAVTTHEGTIEEILDTDIDSALGSGGLG